MPVVLSGRQRRFVPVCVEWYEKKRRREIADVSARDGGVGMQVGQYRQGHRLVVEVSTRGGIARGTVICCMTGGSPCAMSVPDIA
eukprot:2084851-Rhodomonas_salina.1